MVVRQRPYRAGAHGAPSQHDRGLPGEAPATLLIQIDSADLDDETVDQLARQLAMEPHHAVAQSVDPVGAGRRKGAKSGGAVDIARKLAAQLLPAALPSVLAALREWARRPHAPLVKVKGKFGEISFPHDQMTHEQLLELIAAIKKSD